LEYPAFCRTTRHSVPYKHVIDSKGDNTKKAHACRVFLYVPLPLLLLFTIAADTAIWNRLESIGMPWNLLGDLGRHWNYLESDESNWYSLEFIVPRGLLSARFRFGSDSVDEVAFLFFAVELRQGIGVQEVSRH
jgi:hypothetical protein